MQSQQTHTAQLHCNSSAKSSLHCYNQLVTCHFAGPGWKKVDDWTVDPGLAIACNPEGANNTGLDTKVDGATRPSDCLATGGYVLPPSFGQQAIKCTGPSYAPGPYNRLKQCLPCPSGFGAPENDIGLHIQKDQVCQVPPGRFLEGGVVRECPWGLYRSDSVPLDDKR
jgi:hypothetical protein